MTKWVYAFGPEKTEGRGAMKNLLGGKGANLAEMAFLGLPVPPGFSISTEVCTYFYAKRPIRPISPPRSTPPSRRSSGSRDASLATRPIRCCFRCAPARGPRCRA